MRSKSETQTNNRSTTVMSTLRPTCIVHTIPDPDELKVGPHGDIGGFLEVRCETPNHPEFDVEFDGANPDDDNPGKVFHGTISRPVIIPFRVQKEATYQYRIQHYTKGGSKGKRCGPFPFNLHHCPGC